MSNYVQPDFRNPTIASTGVFPVSPTEIVVIPGPGRPANPSQNDFRDPTTAGGVVNVDSELNIVNGPGGPGTYTQPGGPRPGFPNG